MDQIQSLSRLITAAVEYGRNLEPSSESICGHGFRHTYEDVKEYVNSLEHESFFIWEFLASQNLSDDAREYIADHEDTEIPFEWE